MTASCERCESPYETEDLRCPVCALPTPREVRPAAETLAAILRCHGCGAAVSYDPSARAPRCDFCDSVMEVEVPADPVEQAERFLAFRVTPQEARAALRAWLGSRGFLRPSDLREGAAIRELSPLWWVGWVFDATVRVTWAADSDAGARASGWAPHAGEETLELRRVVVPGSRGLTETECRALIDAYDLSGTSATPDASITATVERFTVQRSSVRRIVAQALERVAVRAVSDAVPGKRVRNVKVSVLPRRLQTVRHAFPAYVLAYRYRDRLYRAIVHGQDARRVLGTAPVAWGRVIAVLATLVVAIVLLVLLAQR